MHNKLQYTWHGDYCECVQAAQLPVLSREFRAPSLLEQHPRYFPHWDNAGRYDSFIIAHTESFLNLELSNVERTAQSVASNCCPLYSLHAGHTVLLIFLFCPFGFSLTFLKMLYFRSGGLIGRLGAMQMLNVSVDSTSGLRFKLYALVISIRISSTSILLKFHLNTTIFFVSSYAKDKTRVCVEFSVNIANPTDYLWHKTSNTVSK